MRITLGYPRSWLRGKVTASEEYTSDVAAVPVMLFPIARPQHSRSRVRSSLSLLLLFVLSVMFVEEKDKSEAKHGIPDSRVQLNQTLERTLFQWILAPWSGWHRQLCASLLFTPFYLPLADGFLFQDLLNLSEVIENKGELQTNLHPFLPNCTCHFICTHSDAFFLHKHSKVGQNSS